jgi:hypothetical protein
VLLQGSVERVQSRWVCSGSAYEDQSAAGAMAERVQVGRSFLGYVHRIIVGQSIARGERTICVTEDDGRVRVVDVQFCLGHHVVVQNLCIGECGPDGLVAGLALRWVGHRQVVFHIIAGFHYAGCSRPAFDFVAIEECLVGSALMDES